MRMIKMALVFTLLLMAVVDMTYGKNAGGAIYTRWGRRTCEGAAVLIYEGIVGGSYYEDRGSGGSLLCLRGDPTFNFNNQARSDRATVYGAEYEHPPKSALHNHEVPCVVCQVERWSVLMMPGKDICDEGWTREYSGYISAERSDHYRTDFVCMDDDAEPSFISSPENEDGVLLYPAQTICGSLPCQPYAQDMDLLCVVCTR